MRRNHRRGSRATPGPTGPAAQRDGSHAPPAPPSPVVIPRIDPDPRARAKAYRLQSQAKRAELCCSCTFFSTCKTSRCKCRQAKTTCLDCACRTCFNGRPANGRTVGSGGPPGSSRYQRESGRIPVADQLREVIRAGERRGVYVMGSRSDDRTGAPAGPPSLTPPRAGTGPGGGASGAARAASRPRGTSREPAPAPLRTPPRAAGPGASGRAPRTAPPRTRAGDGRGSSGRAEGVSRSRSGPRGGGRGPRPSPAEESRLLESETNRLVARETAGLPSEDAPPPVQEDRSRLRSWSRGTRGGAPETGTWARQSPLPVPVPRDGATAEFLRRSVNPYVAGGGGASLGGGRGRGGTPSAPARGTRRSSRAGTATVSEVVAAAAARDIVEEIVAAPPTAGTAAPRQPRDIASAPPVAAPGPPPAAAARRIGWGPRAPEVAACRPRSLVRRSRRAPPAAAATSRRSWRRAARLGEQSSGKPVMARRRGRNCCAVRPAVAPARVGMGRDPRRPGPCLRRLRRPRRRRERE